MTISTRLAANKTGRILLHVTCLVRRPRQAAWHYRGILRELNLSRTPAGLALPTGVLSTVLLLCHLPLLPL